MSKGNLSHISKAKPIKENFYWEMANIRKTTTGLPVNIWASPMPKNSRKGIKVRVSNSYSNTIDSNNSFSLYFDGYNVKIEGDTNEIKDEDINKIVDFLIKHRPLFQLFWHYKIDDDELKRRLSEAKDIEWKDVHSNFVNLGPENHRFGVNVCLRLMLPANKTSRPIIKVYKETIDNSFVICLDEKPTKIKVVSGKVFLKAKELNLLLGKIRRHRQALLFFCNAPWMSIGELFDMLGKSKKTKSIPVPTKERANAIKRHIGVLKTHKR